MERLKHIVQINIILGAWLMIAPWVVGYSVSTVESFNDIGLGLLLIACSLWILVAQIGQIGAGTLELLGGFWLIAAPFVLHDGRLSGAFTNDVVVGIFSVLVSATATWMLSSKLRSAA